MDSIISAERLICRLIDREEQINYRRSPRIIYGSISCGIVTSTWGRWRTEKKREKKEVFEIEESTAGICRCNWWAGHIYKMMILHKTNAPHLHALRRINANPKKTHLDRHLARGRGGEIKSRLAATPAGGRHHIDLTKLHHVSCYLLGNIAANLLLSTENTCTFLNLFCHMLHVVRIF